MKILFVLPHLQGGGMVVQASRIIREISKNHQTLLLTLKCQNQTTKEPCQTIYCGDYKLPKGIFDLASKIKKLKNKFDIIQIFDPYYTLPAVKLAGVKKFYIRCGANPLKDLKIRGYKLQPIIFNLLFPHLVKNCKTIVVNSEKLKSELKNLQNVHLIKNGLNFSTQSKSNMLDLPKNKFIISYTGKLAKSKNIEILFKLLKENKTLFLLIIGSKNDTRSNNNYYKYLCNKYKSILNRCYFTGEVSNDEVFTYLKLSDVFLFPSLHESSPNSLIEAMAANVPVICSNTKAHREIVKHEKQGLLFNNLEDLNKLIIQVQKKQIDTSTITQNAKKYVKINHNIKIQAKKYITLYNKLG